MSSSSSSSSQSGVLDDIVIEQEERTFDAGGNLIQVTSRQRFHDDGEAMGPLGDVDNRM